MSEADSHSDRNSSGGDATTTGDGQSAAGAGDGVSGASPSPISRFSRAAKLATAASIWLQHSEQDTGDVVAARNKPARTKPKRTGSQNLPVPSPETRPSLLRFGTDASSIASANVQDSDSFRSASPDADTGKAPLIAQRKIASLLLGAGARSASPAVLNSSTEESFLDAAGVNVTRAESRDLVVGSVETALSDAGNSKPQFPPLSNPFVDKERKSLLTREQEKGLLDMVKQKIEQFKADGGFSEAGSSGNGLASSTTNPANFGAFTFHARTQSQIAKDSGESNVGAPTVIQVSAAPEIGRSITESPRLGPPPSPSLRSKPRSDTESVKTPSLLGQRTDNKAVAVDISLPFQRLDNSLKLWLHLKVLSPAETALGWAAGSYFIQTPPTDAESSAMQMEQSGRGVKPPPAPIAEFAGYFLATTSSLRIYDVTFDIPYREHSFEDATYRNPSRYMKLHHEIALADIVRVDVSLCRQTIVVRCRKAAQAANDKAEPISLVLHLRDSLLADTFLSGLRRALPGDSKNPLWNEGGWWTGLNAVYDLEFTTERLAIFTSAGFVDLERESLLTCAVLSDGTTLAVCEERWQVWPPLLFPPERLPDNLKWINNKVGKVPKKGLLADIVGQFRPAAFSAKLSDFDRAEKWSIRRTDVPFFESWIVQGGLIGNVAATNKKGTKARAGAVGPETQGSAAGWNWAVKLFFRDPSGADTTPPASSTLLFATMASADGFLASLAKTLSIGWSAPAAAVTDEKPKSGKPLASFEGVMFSSSTKL